MRRKAREIYILLYLERTWKRGCHLEYNVRGKELVLIIIIIIIILILIIIIIIMCGR